MAAKVPDPRQSDLLTWQLAMTTAMNELLGYGPGGTAKAALTKEGFDRLVSDKLEKRQIAPSIERGPPSGHPDRLGQIHVDVDGRRVFVAVKKAGADEQCANCEWMELNPKPGTEPAYDPDTFPPDQPPPAPGEGTGGGSGSGACPIDEVNVVTDVVWDADQLVVKRIKIRGNFCGFANPAAAGDHAAAEVGTVILEKELC